MPLTKEILAAQFSVDALLSSDQAEGCFLWTFTFPQKTDVVSGSKAWSSLSRDLVRRIGFFGLRVFELHETHGLHIHVVTSIRFSVDRVRFYSERHGFGRINVKRLPVRAAHYVLKYLGKQRSDSWTSGVRLFQRVNMSGTSIRDIEVCSGVHSLYRALKTLLVNPADGSYFSHCPAMGDLAVRLMLEADSAFRQYALCRVLYYVYALRSPDETHSGFWIEKE